MDLHLSGKTALVTGGSAGIGYACAEALVDEGVAVALVARSVERLAAARARLEPRAAGRTVATIAADLSRGEEVDRAVAEARRALGRIDILVNVAGAARGGPFFEVADQAYLDAWTLKLLGYIRMTRAVAAEMAERRDGRIVNIVGGAGRTPTATFLTGSTANAALLNFTRGVSKELAKHNVRINAISPGRTATERAERLLADEAKNRGTTLDAARAAAVDDIPLHVYTQPSEIAALALLLVSDRVPSMTGSEIVIDGGAQPGV